MVRFKVGDYIRMTDSYWAEFSRYFRAREGKIVKIVSGNYMLKGEPNTIVDEHGAELAEGPW